MYKITQKGKVLLLFFDIMSVTFLNKNSKKVLWMLQREILCSIYIVESRCLILSKTLDLSKSVYELSKEHPDIVEIMKELGFESIASPGMLNTAGRFMTIPKGAAMKSIPLDKIKEVFNSKGYEIKG